MWRPDCSLGEESEGEVSGCCDQADADAEQCGVDGEDPELESADQPGGAGKYQGTREEDQRVEEDDDYDDCDLLEDIDVVSVEQGGGLAVA